MRILPFMKPKKGVTLAGVDYNDDSGGGGGGYTLPTATAERLGGVKVGNGLSITEDGTLSSSGGGGGTYDYSTTEFSTGQKWIDGKTIYGMVKVITSIGTSENFNLPSDIDTIIGLDGVITTGTGINIPFPAYKDDKYYVYCNKTYDGKLACSIGQSIVSYSNTKMYIKLFYTKSS